jgi:hypothetical protein
MPLNESEVEAGNNALNDTVICCGHCHRPADWPETIGENDAPLFELAYPINGPGPARTGAGLEDRRDQLDDFG